MDKIIWWWTGTNRRTYAAMVEEMDQAVGRILETLEAEGMTKDTLVIWCSDNGGALRVGADNSPLRGGKGSAAAAAPPPVPTTTDSPTVPTVPADMVPEFPRVPASPQQCGTGLLLNRRSLVRCSIPPRGFPWRTLY